MTVTFDAAAIEKHGWRQGAVLGADLARAARASAPDGIGVAESDWLIVITHDCDIVNEQLEKEPVAEILRARVVVQKSADKQQVWGRNPRVLQLEATNGGKTVVLHCRVHDRWPIPRELLATEPPAHCLADKARRLIAEWVAKRYIRAAFPTAFDQRWRPKLKGWTALLEKQSRWVQGVYLRLSTTAELVADQPYRCHLIVAVPAEARGDLNWSAKREELGREVGAFWSQFGGAITFDGVDVLGTDELTLADIEPYQRFDADWVSFADDTAATPSTADMRL